MKNPPSQKNPLKSHQIQKPNKKFFKILQDFIDHIYFSIDLRELRAFSLQQCCILTQFFGLKNHHKRKIFCRYALYASLSIELPTVIPIGKCTRMFILLTRNCQCYNSERIINKICKSNDVYLNFILPQPIYTIQGLSQQPSFQGQRTITFGHSL